jgi:hypothetical protein
VERRRDPESEREREGRGDAMRQPAERRLDQVGERRLAEEPDADRRHRDPQLAGGEVFVDAVELVKDPLRRAVPRLDHLLELAAPGADQRELRGYEEAVQRDQEDQGGKRKRGHGVLPPSGREALPGR